MLEVEGLTVRYGEMEAVRGISFRVDAGEVVALIGANGAGKTSSLKAVLGLIRASTGKIYFQGEDIGPLPPWERVRRGISMVPEGRRIFPDLTVERNLLVGAYHRWGDKREVRRKMEEVFSLFPILRERRGQMGKTLSGGEGQMLAIGRALMASPSLLLIDEISLGLMPIYVNLAFEVIKELNSRGVTILLVEQNVRRALEVASRGYVLETGRIVMEGSASQLKDNPAIKQAYLGG